MSEHTFVVLAYKESPYLEKCIQSVLNQDYPSEVVIATSTMNDSILAIANKYNLEVVQNNSGSKGIGSDFDYALTCGQTEVVTIAHQDDIYDREYAKEVMSLYEKNKNGLIIFTDYYEIRDEKKIYENANLKIKRVLLLLLRLRTFAHLKLIKRSGIAFGNAICCPAVSFVKANIHYQDIFNCDMVCDVDWYAWERLSKEKGSFIFVNKALMGHRVHEDSTTTEIISDNIRTKEDLIMFKKFWPKFIANTLNKFYVKSENSNKVVTK